MLIDFLFGHEKLTRSEFEMAIINLHMSCSEEFQGVSFFLFYYYDNYETQELTKVFTCSVQINAALIAPFT